MTTMNEDMATRTNKELLFIAKSVAATEAEKVAARNELWERRCGRGYGKVS